MALWGVVFVLTLGDADLAKNATFIDLGKAGATLAVVTVLGGFVRWAFDERERILRERQENSQFVRNILDDLKSVYDRVEGCRLLVEAHRSAKTYGDQIRGLVDGVVTLHKIKRALDPEWPTLKEKLRAPIDQMNRYLKRLIAEFRDNYRKISRMQEAEEAWNKAARESLFGSNKKPGDYAPQDRAWGAIEDLPVLRELRDDALFAKYEADFLTHLDTASSILRAELPGGEPTLKEKPG